MPPIIDRSKCIGCGICADICQTDVFFGSKKNEVPTVTFPEECWHCDACVLECPKEGAIRLRIPLPLMAVYK